MSVDILIVGGGPAALTAALYSLRGGYSVKFIEKEAIGGQIADSPRVENYPTIPEISGLELSNRMFEQVTSLGADFDMDDVQSIQKTSTGFLLRGTYGEYEGRAVILATGVKHRHLGILGEDRFLGHGVSYCAVCDGSFYAQKDVVVVGDANSALQYALFLAKTCNHVALITLFDRFFADAPLVKALDEYPNISVQHNLSAQSFNGDALLESITFQNTKSKELVTVPCAGAFVAIGQIPDNDRFANLLDLDHGYIVTNEEMETRTPGLFAAGDCRVKKWRQVITACGDGAIASLSAQRYLSVISSK
ncbi:MAG: FAD-dependent oxidoreductase [Erysipelotrichaceae bacterium]|nr:FAD-dependent oxidoreductase [Erysipelotrichaceae bacterium]